MTQQQSPVPDKATGEQLTAAEFNSQKLAYDENATDAETRLTANADAIALKQDALPIPRLIGPKKLYVVKNETVQMFWRGVIESNTPYGWNIKTTSPFGTDGKNFPRYYELNHPDSAAEDLIVTLYDDAQNEIATVTIPVVVRGIPANPSTSKNMLCVGDSLTANGPWCNVLETRLNMSNVNFIGTQSTSGTANEGHSGKFWSWFTENEDSPFVKSGVFSFDTYCTDNAYSGIDFMYILLTWNMIEVDRATAADNQDFVDDAKVFLRQLKTDYPDALVKLMGIPGPSTTGGVATNFGDTVTTGNYYGLVRTVNGLNLAYEALADDPEFSTWVEFVNTSSQFDAEYGHAYDDKPVNQFNTTQTEEIGNNAVHPSTEGYSMIADTAYRVFDFTSFVDYVGHPLNPTIFYGGQAYIQANTACATIRNPALATQAINFSNFMYDSATHTTFAAGGTVYSEQMEDLVSGTYPLISNTDALEPEINDVGTLVFDGNTTCHSTYKMTDGDNFSFEFIYNRTDWILGQRFLGFAGSSSKNVHIQVYSDNKITMTLFKSGSGTFIKFPLTASGYDGTNQHMIFTYDSVAGGRLYRNGVLNSQDNDITGTIDLDPAEYSVGGTYDGVTGSMQGKVGMNAFYDGVTLDQTDVTAAYNWVVAKGLV